jgi:virulence-associated protein VagC
MFKEGLFVLLGAVSAVRTSAVDKRGPIKFCPDKLQAVYDDMHDGDKKEITISGTSLTIKPSSNNQTWVVSSEIDSKSCSASINFNVPGKPSPPPVNLQATLWYYVSSKGKKTVIQFTDPSGTLAPKESKEFPLNEWVEEEKKDKKMALPCPTKLHAVYADMHDGDKKEVTISGSSLTIKPSGNDQTWVVKSEVDSKTCSASIDFKGSGKPGSPPVSLQATLAWVLTATAKKTEFEFTDPTGTLAPASVPLNHWVEISSELSRDQLV